MLLTVQVSELELEECGRILSVGDREQFWLTFEEAERRAPAPLQINAVHGVAVPLSSWPGAGFGRYPVRIDVEGAALYWDAPEKVTGPIDVAGTISTNTIDAPDGFPETSGILRRVQMMWHDFVMGPDGVWRSAGHETRYEDVTSTYFPVHEPKPFDPEVEAELRRLARAAYDREMAAGRLSPEETFGVGMKVPASKRRIPVGTTKTSWTGVLIDLETAAS